jgi:hypothetical protein
LYEQSPVRVQAKRWTLLLHFSDLEDFRATVWARTLDRRATILHRHMFGVFDLDLLSLLDAVTLGHR